MPSGVVVAQGTLNPLAQVRILARQPLAMFPSSSVVERAAVNRLAVGSNPTSGASYFASKLSKDKEPLSYYSPIDICHR